MKNITSKQYALAGVVLIGIWVVILSQEAIAYVSGFGVLFSGLYDGYAARTPLIFVSIFFWSLAIWCFYKATRSNK